MKLNALGRASIMRPLPVRGGGARAKRTSAQLLPKSQFLGNPVVGKRWSKPEEERTVAKASEVVTETASAVTSITNLGKDLLVFLGSTVFIIPVFKRIKLSPILGFLALGFGLQQLDLIQDPESLHLVAELGVLFLLFEMGLELSSNRLKSLFSYAFGLGSLQVVITAGILALSLYPIGGSNLLVSVLEQIPGLDYSLMNIRDADEAVVIGTALALSSSAFVLQILSERGELPTRFGSATLGVLLFQDIAVVPLLVLLPLIEKTGGFDGVGAQGMTLISQLGVTAVKSVGLLGCGIIVGQLLIRRVFEFVAESRSTEAFVAAILLTATASSYATSSLGFSDSLGAFVAGVVLAETNYRTQIEADIKPFKGLLLGLFFVATGSSIDSTLLVNDWPTVLILLTGLILVKSVITGVLAPFFGLNRSESLRIALTLSQGGEFAFVLLTLANQLNLLPGYLTRMLIIVVVCSMALTPFLSDLATSIATWLDGIEADWQRKKLESTGSLGGPRPAIAGGVIDVEASAAGSVAGSMDSIEEEHPWGPNPILICGMGPSGQVISNMLESPLSAADGRKPEANPARKAGLRFSGRGTYPYVVFDLTVKRVYEARQLGLPVIYGDGSKREVLQAAGIEYPVAIVVVYTSVRRSVASVERLRALFPSAPIYARANDLAHASELTAAGATKVTVGYIEDGLELGSSILQEAVGVDSSEVEFLRTSMRTAFDNHRFNMSRGGEENAGNLHPQPMQLMSALRLKAPVDTASVVGVVAAEQQMMVGVPPPAPEDFKLDSMTVEANGSGPMVESERVPMGGDGASLMNDEDSIWNTAANAWKSMSGGKGKKKNERIETKRERQAREAAEADAEVARLQAAVEAASRRAAAAAAAAAASAAPAPPKPVEAKVEEKAEEKTAEPETKSEEERKPSSDALNSIFGFFNPSPPPAEPSTTDTPSAPETIFHAPAPAPAPAARAPSPVTEEVAEPAAPSPVHSAPVAEAVEVVVEPEAAPAPAPVHSAPVEIIEVEAAAPEPLVVESFAPVVVEEVTVTPPAPAAPAPVFEAPAQVVAAEVVVEEEPEEKIQEEVREVVAEAPAPRPASPIPSFFKMDPRPFSPVREEEEKPAKVSAPVAKTNGPNGNGFSNSYAARVAAAESTPLTSSPSPANGGEKEGPMAASEKETTEDEDREVVTASVGRPGSPTFSVRPGSPTRRIRNEMDPEVGF